ncbi:hypothetical protein M2152_001237 [Microbacteriaceae bacterium SG_E_30_P1]|uniref:non-specific serine/threonine protein kinase n=1 Tax=Antiquaquibacter oligotrophicus TaxID=2880260 RepID=A0ABT6KM36_9MICO|nr:protein kinase [Antiquaquibacter oligotrophicus]MDH6181055.1 hypothetical protein [Antiquaquibacter oligotrophicus]UDF13247.1 protein kinase [Antiquaquibacter oligotrophicus]
MGSDIVGGYRLTRLLAEGRRAEVYLAHCAEPSGEAEPVAVKLYRSVAELAEIQAEMDVLAAAAGPHVVRLIDVASAPDRRPALIMERHGPRTLGELLASRTRLEIGEAATILVPLARAVERMHGTGAVHGRISPESVLFSADGAPVLARFGRGQVTDASTPAERDANPLFAADLESYRRLAEAVLALADAHELATTLMPSTSSESWADLFSARLFERDRPRAVDFEGAEDRQSFAIVSHASGQNPGRRRDIHTDRRPAAGAADRWARALRVTRTMAATVRPRFWIVGAAALATLLIAVIAVPPPATDAVPPASPRASPSTTLPPSGVVVSDDPVEAVGELLLEREKCFEQASLLCLDGVDHLGSAAMEADSRAIQMLHDGADDDGTVPRFRHPVQAELREQLGGSVVVSLTLAEKQPASVLMIRTEAGWRIRAFLL